MVQPHHHFALYLQIETKFMTRNKIFFCRFIYFGNSFGKMPIDKPFYLNGESWSQIGDIAKGKNQS